MAYRRKQGITKESTFREDVNNNPPSYLDVARNGMISSPSPSPTAQAIRAPSSQRDPSSFTRSSSFKGPAAYDYTSLRTTNDRGGLWNIVARNAKSLLDEDNKSEQFARPNQKPYNSNYSTNDQFYHPHQSVEGSRPVENNSRRKGWDTLRSTFGNALEERRSRVENKNSDIVEDTQKWQIRRKGTYQDERNHVSGVRMTLPEPSNYARPRMQFNQQTQLKASRDVAMATTTKAKLLLRELKTVKADLAYAKQRCSQLEEENKILREAYEKDDHPAEDEMIRLQLEALLSEKARLIHENSALARENNFLRETVEYHQLTMQDLLDLDEEVEEGTEHYPKTDVSRVFNATPPSNRSPAPEKSSSRSSAVALEDLHAPPPVQTKSSQPDTILVPDSAPAQLQTQAMFPDTIPAPVDLQ
ncbi:Developmental and secondary metabolism regulator veA like [Heracleum sosnowskyi]|uniref:Developmental and secondary metabolism regulator veA like n=1 Tax=Heracleum sosnowskyi TaxID=360622 RepID=A0AAD8J908_9APIA|nr:Developmental and secondary metabolism regulator veA like [Heracleum sosnowskyi]